MKFKKGDRVRVVKSTYGHCFAIGTVVKLKRESGLSWDCTDGKSSWFLEPSEFELITKGETMSRRTFRLLKETPEWKEGAIVQEMCDDGTRDFELLNIAFAKYVDMDGAPKDAIARKAVLDEPKWFEEVFNPAEQWFTADELKAFKEFTKKQLKAKK